MGTGGVGGFLGARLALAGNDVTFVARGEHLRALQRKGLKVDGVKPAFVPGVLATDAPEGTGIPELILFCVKLYDSDDAATVLKPVVGPDTTILTLQNGVESSATLAGHFNEQQILAGAAYFPANITAPGVITYLGKIAEKPHVAFGEPGAGPSARAEQIADTFREANLAAEVAQDTERMLWEKFLLIAGTSAATTLCRMPIGGIREDADRRWLLRTAIEEAHDVAVAAGVQLDADIVDTVVATLDGNPVDGKSSQLVDLENGKRLELDGLSGAIVRRGLEYGVPTPVHRTVYAALKQLASPDVARAAQHTPS